MKFELFAIALVLSTPKLARLSSCWCGSTGSKGHTQANLPFSAGQGLRDRAQRCRLTRLDLDRSRIRVVEQIKELKQPLYLETIVNGPSFGNSQIHIHKRWRREGVATRSQIATVEGSVAILIDGLRGRNCVPKPALRPKQAAELDFPRQLHETVEFEGVSKSEIGRAAVEFGAIVIDSRLAHVVAIGREDS